MSELRERLVEIVDSQLCAQFGGAPGDGIIEAAAIVDAILAVIFPDGTFDRVGPTEYQGQVDRPIPHLRTLRPVIEEEK